MEEEKKLKDFFFAIEQKCKLIKIKKSMKKIFIIHYDK